MTLLTYAQVADELAVSKRTVERMVADKQLRAVTMRGARRVRSEDLEAYVDRLPAVGEAAATAAQARRPKARRDPSFREKLGVVA